MAEALDNSPRTPFAPLEVKLGFAVAVASAELARASFVRVEASVVILVRRA